MKKPEKKKEERDKICGKDWFNYGYNDACDEWEKYHEEEMKKWRDMCPPLYKAKIRELQQQLQDLKEDLSCAKGTIDYYENSLPSEEEIELLLEEMGISTITYEETPYHDIKTYSIKDLAKAIHKRIGGNNGTT